nr:MAG TPA: hypothetical protein [Caudoviricetes sp.]
MCRYYRNSESLLYISSLLPPFNFIANNNLGLDYTIFRGYSR